MKLQDLNENLLFDEFPITPQPNQIIFFSNLFWITDLEHFILPKKLFKIYINKKLFAQFRHFAEDHRIEVNQVIILPEYQPLLITLSKKESIEILTCTSADTASPNAMFLIRKVGADSDGGKVTHIYADIFTDFRTAFLNETFIKWIKPGVEKLYINFTRMDENCCKRETQKLVEEIESIVEKGTSNFIIKLPEFGCETFLDSLTRVMFARACISGKLEKSYSAVTKDTRWKPFHPGSKLYIIAKNDEKAILERPPVTTDWVTLYITPEKPRSRLQYFWSPLPKPFDMAVFVKFLSPLRVNGTIHRHSFKTKISKWLKHLCRTCQGRSPRKKQSPNISLTQQSEALTQTQSPTANNNGVDEGNNMIGTSPGRGETYRLKRKRALCYEDDNDDERGKSESTKRRLPELN